MLFKGMRVLLKVWLSINCLRDYRRLMGTTSLAYDELQKSKWRLSFNKTHVLCDFTGDVRAFHSYHIDTKRKVRFDDVIEVHSSLQASGLGRALVEASEKLCRERGVELVVINNCENGGFWDHLGYKRLLRGQRESFLEYIGVVKISESGERTGFGGRYCCPRYKLL